MELGITQEAAGHTADGLPLYVFTLCNRHGMEIRISTLGAALAGLRAPDRAGRLADVVHGGAPALAQEAGIHLLPAPGKALHRQAWHAVPLVELASVGVRLTSPGPLPVLATYVLDDANGLTLHCQAPAAPRAMAPVCICLRTAWNLAGDGDLGGQLLTLRAARVAPIPGAAREVAGSAWDWRSPRPLQDLPGAARFLLETEGGAPAAPVLRLFDPVSGRQLEISTDAASVRLAPGDPPRHLWLEPVLAAGGGSIHWQFSAQA